MNKKETLDKKKREKIAGAVFFGIIWLFISGVSSFFSYVACKIIFTIGILFICFKIMKGGYNGIFRKGKHSY